MSRRGTRDWASVAGDLAPARRALRELLANAPRREELWAELNSFYLADHAAADRAEGFAGYEQAVAALPDASWLFARFAAFAMASGELDRARAAAESGLAHGPDARVRSSLETTLVELDGREAERLRQAGEPAEGRRILEARRAASVDAAARVFATDALRRFDQASLVSSIEEAYQAAIALVNTGKIEEGAAALRKIVAEHPESLSAETAKHDLAQIEAYLARRAKRSAPPPPPPSS